MKKVSFDFDGTLEMSHIKNYAKELVSRGIEVWIVTARYDNDTYMKQFSTTRENADKANNDLFEIATQVGIPTNQIVFMNQLWKYTFFKDHPEFAWHIDDDWLENSGISRHSKVKGINSWGNSSWKTKCERYLNR